MTSAEKSLLCRRDAERRIVALTREVLDPKVAKGEGWEPVRADDPEVRQFLEQGDDLPSQLALSDAGMGRVTEDLIDVLIDRGVIQFTDLPAAAQIRLMARRTSRQEMANRLSSIVPSEGESDDDVL